jgi:hypothetical protein
MKFFGECMIKYHGFERYNPAVDYWEPTFFEGLYFLEDYAIFEKHKGKKIVFWNGSDLDRLLWFEDIFGHGHIKERQEVINNNLATHLCHDSDQVAAIKKIGVIAKVHPLFFGDLKKYTVSYKRSDRPQVYSNAHPFLEGRYDIPHLLEIAEKAPDIIFNIYGINAATSAWCPVRDNVVYHGEVPEEEHDEQIKGFQACFQTVIRHPRLSQTCLKSAFMGQWPISTTKDIGIAYADTDEGIIEYLKNLKYKKEPNYTVSEHFTTMFEYQWERVHEF